MVAGLIIRGVGIALKGFGKALKESKRKARRQKLGLPPETNKQIRTRLKKSERKVNDE